MVITEKIVMLCAIIFVFGPAAVGLLFLVFGILVARNEEKRQKHKVFVFFSFLIATLGVIWTLAWLALSISGVLDGRTRKEWAENHKQIELQKETEKEKNTAIKNAEKDKGGTQYIYDNPDVIHALSIIKSVYDRNELRIYIYGGISDKFNVSCYNKNHYLLEEKFDTSYKDGCFSIKGDSANLISGVVFSSGESRYMIRHLDTNQYAILYDTFVCDIGWELCDGDESLYYTREEIAAREEHIAAAQKKYEDTYKQFEGMWVSPEDENVYLKIYEADGIKTLEKSEVDTIGNYHLSTYQIDDISLHDAYYGKELSIVEGISWGIELTFKWDEETQTLTERCADATTYIRKKRKKDV